VTWTPRPGGFGSTWAGVTDELIKGISGESPGRVRMLKNPMFTSFNVWMPLWLRSYETGLRHCPQSSSASRFTAGASGQPNRTRPLRLAAVGAVQSPGLLTRQPHEMFGFINEKQVAGVVEILGFEFLRAELQLNFVVADDASVHRALAKVCSKKLPRFSRSGAELWPYNARCRKPQDRGAFGAMLFGPYPLPLLIVLFELRLRLFKCRRPSDRFNAGTMRA
jgi:hypothetical protein